VSESITLVTVVVGFGLVTVVIAWLGDGHLSLGAFLPVQPRDEWPRGVQEGDVPHFAVEHVDALRPGSDGSAAAGDMPGSSVTVDRDDQPVAQPEIVELYTRRLAPRH
jgi:hypothetical protein